MSDPLPTRRRRRGLKIAGAVLAALIVLLALTAVYVSSHLQQMAVYVLQQQGYQASIEKVSLVLRDARLVGKNIKIEKGKDSIHLDRLDMNFDWRALWDKRLRVVQLKIAGLKIEQVAEPTQPGDSIDRNASGSGRPGWLLGLQSLELENSEFCYSNEKTGYCVTVAGLNWKGNTRFDTGMTGQPLETMPLALDGSVVLNGVVLAQPKQTPLIAWKQLSVENLKINSLGDIRLGNLLLQDLVLPRQAPDRNKQAANNLVRLNTLSSDQISMTSLGKIDLGSVKLAGLDLNLVREKNGHWEITDHFQALPGSTSTKPGTAKTEKDTGSPVISVKRLSIEKGGRLVYEDRTFATPLTVDLQQFAFSITDLDSTHTDRASPFSLVTKVGQHGALELDGTLQLFASTPTFDVKGKMSGIDLRMFSPYFVFNTGHKVKSGQLSGDLALVADAGMLDGVANLELQQFTLEVVDQEQVDELAERQGASLTTALALMREKDKSIKLAIPIKGDIADPQFNIDDAFKQILNKGIMQAIESYYTDYGLTMIGYGQYGLVVTGAIKLFEFLSQLRFTPVTFDAGQHKIDTEQKAYLDNLANMLNERPKVHLSLCGFATVADLRALDSELVSGPAERWQFSSLTNEQKEMLMQLANARAAGIKEYLVTQKSIDARRLIVCEPQYTPTTDTLPRVEITL